MKKVTAFLPICVLFFMSCNNNAGKEKKLVRLVTLDPGHFHAALVQKTMYADVDSTVYVYAPGGNDLKLHLDRVNGYNNRAAEPTHWKEEVYTGNDFFEKMIAEKKGNVVVLSGNNRKKADYILTSLQNGFNVLADKPMAIDSIGFEKLKQAFETADKNSLLLYDIMTERYEITTILQRELSLLPGVFGTQEKGSTDNPGITKESVHFFYKYVSGNVVTRPGWFFDAAQQGEGIVDVMTHLVDLVQWDCFPEQAIDYVKDIKVEAAKHWATPLTLEEFKTLTNLGMFPSYLIPKLAGDGTLPVFSNGEINYEVRGIHAKTTVTWEYKAPEGTGDTHHSVMRGSKANLVIKQDAPEKYLPTLYIEPINPDATYEKTLIDAFKIIQSKYPGVELKKIEHGWQVIIPEKYNEGHEAHFARVTEKFLDYLKNNNMPAWEKPCMITKYFITTKGLQMALKK